MHFHLNFFARKTSGLYSRNFIADRLTLFEAYKLKSDDKFEKPVTHFYGSEVLIHTLAPALSSFSSV